jgi:O-antigen/teichoic acid export membrane protein
MGDAERITRNTGVLLIAQVISIALSLVFFILLARRLGSTSLGEYTFAFDIAGVFLIFSDLGLATLIVKEVAKDKKKAQEYLSGIFSLKLFATSIFAAASVLYVAITAASAETVLIFSIVMLGSFFNSLTEPFKNIFLAYEKHQYYAAITLFERVLSVGLGLFLLFTGKGLVQILWAFAFSYFLTFIVSCLLAWAKITRFSVSTNFIAIMSFLKSSWPFLLSFLFMSIYYATGTAMLTWMTNYAIVGWYGASYRLVNNLSFIPLIVVTALFPTMAKFHIEDKKMLQVLYQKAFNYLAIIAIPLAIGVTLLAGKIVMTIYGPQYVHSIPVLRLLIWAEVFIFFNYVMGYLLNATDKQLWFTITTGAYLILNAALNFFLIPLFQQNAAAATSIAAQLFGFVLLFYYCSRSGYSLNLIKLLWKPLFASAAMAIVIGVLFSLNLFAVIIAGAAAYIAVMFLIRGIGKEELTLVRKVLRL